MRSLHEIAVFGLLNAMTVGVWPEQDALRIYRFQPVRSRKPKPKIVNAMFNGVGKPEQYVNTPEPVSKRRKRRLRGKGD